METKRCAYCHKLQHADAQTCRRCGQSFGSKRVKGVQASPREFTRPTLPSASPHRAGHYAGLHPEDQPYESNKIAIQRPHADSADRGHLPEPEQILFPSTDSTPALKVYRKTRQPLPLNSDEVPATQLPLDSDEAPATRLSLDSDEVPVVRPPLAIYTSFWRPKSFLSSRAISIILTCACLLFLLASSIIAFVHINSHTLARASFTASPSIVYLHGMFTLTGDGFGVHDPVLFSCDNNETLFGASQKPLQTNTNDLGAFQIKSSVPADWQAGIHRIYVTDQVQKQRSSTSINVQAPPSAAPPATPPHLQLAMSTLDLHSAAAGVISHQTITLTNSGSGQLGWQASSDQSWLTSSLVNGTFTSSEDIQIIANRANFAPKNYTGHITFKQQNSDTTVLTLTVTMSVDAAATPASLILSTAALTYATPATQNPPVQTMTIQNAGGKGLTWSSTSTTQDGAAWLSLDPSEGYLKPDSSAVLTVSIHSQTLAAGTYSGQISFVGTTFTQVSISLSVLAPANLNLSSSALNFSTTAGQQPVSQSITLQNTGGTALNWMAATDQGAWLSVTPIHGSLDPGAQARITVSIDASTLGAGVSQGTVTFTVGTGVKQVAVALTIVAPPTPTPTPTPVLEPTPSLPPVSTTSDGRPVLADTLPSRTTQ